MPDEEISDIFTCYVVLRACSYMYGNTDFLEILEKDHPTWPARYDKIVAEGRKLRQKPT